MLSDMAKPKRRESRELEMTHVVKYQPKVAKDRILSAYKVAGCSLRAAAPMLGCTERTLHRWVYDHLDMGEDLEKLTRQAEREGWLHKKRRPVKGEASAG